MYKLLWLLIVSEKPSQHLFFAHSTENNKHEEHLSLLTNKQNVKMVACKCVEGVKDDAFIFVSKNYSIIIGFVKWKGLCKKITFINVLMQTFSISTTNCLWLEGLRLL